MIYVVTLTRFETDPTFRDGDGRCWNSYTGRKILLTNGSADLLRQLNSLRL